MFARIFKGLDEMDLRGEQAAQAARLGFLEWALTLDGSCSADQAARTALDQMGEAREVSPAARAFVDYIAQAANPLPLRCKRRGGRRRVLN